MSIKTIKGRWEECKKQLPADIDKAEETRLMLAFYGGFAACLEFNMEIADIHELDAIIALQQVQQEADTIAAAAQRAFGEVKPS